MFYKISRRKSRLVLRGGSGLHGESSSLFGDDPSGRSAHFAFECRIPLQFVQNSNPQDFFEQLAYSLTMTFVMLMFRLFLVALVVVDRNIRSCKINLEIIKLALSISNDNVLVLFWQLINLHLIGLSSWASTLYLRFISSSCWMNDAYSSTSRTSKYTLIRFQIADDLCKCKQVVIKFVIIIIELIFEFVNIIA